MTRQIELAARNAAGTWSVLAIESGDADLTSGLSALGGILPQEPRTMGVGGREYVAPAQRLDPQGHGTSVVTVVGYSLDDALQITESAGMGEPETAILVLRGLADQGISVAIDDFGVGQSSFAYLRRLSVNEIKIDKTFV